ncbi:MAG: tetratricopeptide repeat protein [Bacteroidia bacterium]
MRFRILLLLIFLKISVSAQQNKQKEIDSLNAVIQTSNVDTLKIKAMNSLVNLQRSSNPEKADSMAKQIISLSQKCNYPKGEIAAWMSRAVIKYFVKKDYEGGIKDYNTAMAICKESGNKKKLASCITGIGVIYWSKGELPKALEKYNEGLKIQLDINDSAGAAGTYINMGNVYLYQSDYPHALDSYQKGQTIFEEKNDLEGIATSVSNMGSIYSYIKLYDKAIESYQKGADAFFKLSKKDKAATSLNGIGVIYSRKKEFSKAINYHNKALALQEEMKDLKGIPYTLIYIGDALMNMEKFDESKIYFLRSLKLAETVSDKHAMISDLSHLGNIAINAKDYKKAEDYLDKSLTFAKKTDSKDELQSIYKYLSELYKKTNRPAPALDYFQKFTALSDSSMDQDRAAELTRNQMQYEFDKQKEISKIEQDKIDIEKESELKHQKLIRNFFIAGSFFLLMFAFVIYKSLREKNKANIEISKQKEIILEKNKDITDSINYAKRIQDAILPDKELKYRIFPDAFVMLHPKDIVSGDFYWFSEKNGKRLISAVDCTGHGVPGAFMSMIGNAFLNEIVNEKGITEPGIILSELRTIVIKALKQTGAGGEQRDGMDISLLSFSADNTVEWAGANNPLWLIRKGELIEYKPDKRPIGFFKGQGLPFTNHKIQLEKGDSLYIFTDGYADQFGGPKGKKFKYTQLKEVLLSIQNLPMLKQEEFLMQKFKSWQGNLDQIDDVCIIGVRV